MKNRKIKIITLVWGFLILFFSFQMLQITIPYLSWERDIDFLRTKQHIIHLDYYRMAFYSHIFSSLMVLVGGAFLFSKWVIRELPKLHRFMGKTYVILVLLISAPTGLVMAFHANGGWSAKLSFIILSGIWWWFTYKGYQTARLKKFKVHKKWMIRSYALTLSAITLRLSQMVLAHFTELDLVTQYVLVSWGSWVINLAVAEAVLILKEKQSKSKSIEAHSVKAWIIQNFGKVSSQEVLKI